MIYHLVQNYYCDYNDFVALNHLKIWSYPSLKLNENFSFDGHGKKKSAIRMAFWVNNLWLTYKHSMSAARSVGSSKIFL